MEFDLLREHMDKLRENKPRSVGQWGLVGALGLSAVVLAWHLFVRSDVEAGGRVETIAVEGGQHVEKGDLILRLSNATLQRTAIETEISHRTAVVFGRHNPREVEVLDGLRAGDRIITSAYDTFNAADELHFTPTLRISQGAT